MEDLVLVLFDLIDPIDLVDPKVNVAEKSIYLLLKL